MDFHLAKTVIMKCLLYARCWLVTYTWRTSKQRLHDLNLNCTQWISDSVVGLLTGWLPFWIRYDGEERTEKVFFIFLFSLFSHVLWLALRQTTQHNNDDHILDHNRAVEYQQQR